MGLALLRYRPSGGRLMTALRIETITPRPGVITLQVTGQVVGTGVDVLEQEHLLLAADTSTRVELDLSQVTYVSNLGVELLRRLAQKGTPIVNCPPLIAEILADAPGRNA